MRRTHALILTAALALAPAACQPPTTTTTTTTTVATTSPARYVYADSLGAQIDSAGLTDDGRIWQIESGSALSRWEPAVLEAAATVPRSITLALGSNEALSGGGWTPAVQATWERVAAAVDPRTCLTVVLPHFEPQIEEWWPGALAQAETVRAGMSALPGVDQVRDWRPPVAQHPDWIGDGVHLWFIGGADMADDPAFVGRYETVTGGACP